MTLETPGARERERRSDGPRTEEHLAAILCAVDFARCKPALQVHWSPKRQDGMGLHLVDDIYGCGEASSIRDFVACLGDAVQSKGGDIQ